MRLSIPVSLLWLISFSPSCMPFLVPPMRVSTGPAWQSSRATNRVANNDDKPYVSVRAALHPLAALGDGDKKRFDVGLGYGLEGKQDEKSSDLHGPYLEVAAFPLRVPLSETVAFRAGASASIEALYRRGESEGHFGTTVGPLVEVTQNVTGPFESKGDDGSAFGAATGYWGLGFYGSAAFRNLEAGLERSYSVGMSLRLPLAFGILCCAIPTSSEGSEVSHSSSHSHRQHHEGHRDRRRGDTSPTKRIPAKPRPDK